MYCKVLIIIGIISTLSCRMNAQSSIDHPISSSMPGNIAKESVLYFRFDRSTVDYGYHNNRKVLSSLHELFSDSLCTSCIDSIRIRTYSSPEGDAGYNRRLALQRARAVKGYLVWKYPHLDQHCIHTSAHAKKWDALRSIAERDTLLPCRNEILQILNLNRTPDRGDEHIEVLLKKLNAGIPYRYISGNILPDLRNASICTVYMRPLKHPGTDCYPVPVLTSNSFPSFRAERRLYHNSIIKRGFERKLIPSPVYTQGVDSSATLRMTGNSTRKPLLAVKTNLLFDAALMPNIEVEVPIGKRFSLNGEYTFPWWRMDGDKYCMQLLIGGLEARYWLGNRGSSGSHGNRMNREVLTGHFLGLYAGGGKYDLQWKENGYQGEFFIAAGISYGYVHSIARNLRLEYNIGIGLLRTDYRHYHARDDYQTLLWQENGRYTWIGPTKLKISLVWLLTRKTGKGGEK